VEYNVESVLFTVVVRLFTLCRFGQVGDEASRDLDLPVVWPSTWTPQHLKPFSMAEDELTDDYIASLLKQDAKNSSLRYAQVGLGALLPKKYVINQSYLHSYSFVVDETHRPQSRTYDS
jgi:hypothetical protein